MKTLYLDTSSSFLYAGIVSNNVLIDAIEAKLDKELSSFSLPKIKDMMEIAQIDPKDIDRIMVVNGPGSFTGIRIGLTIAKTYAWAMKLPIITVSSLNAMALSGSGYDYYVPVLDARHNCVFGAIYDKEGNAVVEDNYMPLEELKQQIDKQSGTKAMVTLDDIPLNLDTIPYHPDILKIVATYDQSTPTPVHAVEPNYLKKTEAEESLQKSHDS